MRRATVAACLLGAAAGCDGRACDPEAAAAAWQCEADCAPGTLGWRQAYQGGISAYAGDPVIDACGGLVVVGKVSPDRSTDSQEAFVARYRANGELAWLRVTGAPGDDGATAAAPTADGGIIVVGQSLGNTWVARYEVDGAREWSRTFDDGELGGAHDVAIDRHGRPVVVGRAGIRWLDEDGRELRVAPDRDGYGAYHLAIAADGRLAVAYSDALAVTTEDGAELWRTPDRGHEAPIPRFLGDGTLVMLSDSTLDAFDAAGQPLWSRTLVDPDGRAWASTVTVDASDRIAIVGTEELDGRRRAWAAALAANGEAQWRWSIDLTTGSEADGLVAGPDGSLLVVASVDHGAYVGGIDRDVWLGRLHR